MTDRIPAAEAAASPTNGKAAKTSRGAATKRPHGGGAGKAPKKAATPKKRAVTPAQGATKAKRAATADGGGRVRKARSDTKQAKLIAMLKAKDGTTVAEIAKVFGWQLHTVRGALYGALKKKLGLDVISEKVGDRGRVYRIGS